MSKPRRHGGHGAWAIKWLMLLPVAGCASDAVVRRDIDDLKNTKEIPYEPPYKANDPFWRVVGHGKAALPYLVGKLDDATGIDYPVNFCGGDYAIGDVALLAMMHIVHDLPVESWVEEPFRAQFKQKGFCAYYDYVRASPINRVHLKKAIEEWLSEHMDGLRWEKAPEFRQLPSGGYWVAGGRKDD